ncbi:hypothetical protein K9M47_01260 [Candidatus Gracilibacteria bacterium]|nr:hypothetical protein [Candidatus Gracilibacteria bacterium]MCF7898614.1 hypothetical protein [Candidatus Paceibacterota bacterium]
MNIAKSSSQHSFNSTETRAVRRELMVNNVAIAVILVSMSFVGNTWFAVADSTIIAQQLQEFYLLGYCITFGLLFLLLVGVISIRPNDKVKRFLVRGIWDKLLY